MTMEHMIIAYLFVALMLSTYKWIVAGRLIDQLIKERDKYKQAWVNDTNVLLWEKNEKSKSN
jgi:hypothetical protein